MSCPIRYVPTMVDSRCPVRLVYTGVLAYSVYLSMRAALSIKNRKNDEVKMPLTFDLKGQPRSFVTSYVGVVTYPMIVLGQISVMCKIAYSANHTAKVTNTCQLTVFQRWAMQTLSVGTAVTLLAQHYAVKIVCDGKTPAEVAEVNKTADKKTCHEGKCECYLMPPCLLVISVIAMVIPTVGHVVQRLLKSK
eukprot:Tbor_TRINITY_DN6044_c0_g3::TRINITY_DN6044_c0_g3_i1::g.11339::m.11339